jgi:8-oxo-dGTP pyrophosphatase MutT (NUDIX family)
VTKRIATGKTLVINEKDELLLLWIEKHTERPERSKTWDLPGGFIDHRDASEKEGALRELDEEAGIKLDQGDVQLVYALTGYYKEHDVSVTHLTYLAKLNNTPEVTISWEHDDYKWVNFADVLDHYTLRPHYEKAITHVLDHHLY